MYLEIFKSHYNLKLYGAALIIWNQCVALDVSNINLTMILNQLTSIYKDIGSH